MDLLRSKILAKGTYSLRTIQRLFKQNDENKDNRLDFDEFHSVIEQFGIDLPKEQLRECFHDVDRDRSGFVSREELIYALRPQVNSQRRELIQAAFKKLDRNGDGVLRVEDIRALYSAKQHPKFVSGEMTEDEIFHHFLQGFHGPGVTVDTITRDDFENYYAAISVGIEDDSYFDLMMRRAWKL